MEADLDSVLFQASVWVLPVLIAITLHDLEQLAAHYRVPLIYFVTPESVTKDEALSLERMLQADPALLRQVFFNLMLNASNAVGQGGNIAVRTETDGNGGMSVAVSDDGPGVPEAEREAVFRPYYTGSANGTGLGLAVVCQIIHAQHWEVTCEDNGGGACFRIAGLRTVESAHP